MIDETPPVNPSDAEHKNSHQFHLRTKPIAVFDSDRDSIESLSHAIGKKGYKIHPWDEKSEPLAFLGEIRPCAVVTEIELGGITGFDLCREIKADPHLASVPVIFVSEKSGVPERAEGIRAGSDAFLPKPVNSDAIQETLQNFESANQEVPARILAMEDDGMQNALLKNILEGAGFIFDSCTEPEELLDMLDSFNPDLLIMDLKLPRYNGFELARVLRQNNCYLTMPILFLTSSSQEASYIESLKAGSDDFLAKPANPQILIDSIRYRTKRYLQIRALTDQDGLTHMLNRASLMRQFESIFSRTARYREALSITMIDIDHFKTINDTYGHQAGDWVLRSLSNFLQEALRKSDIIGRYGGEEFILLLPQIGAEDSLRVVDRIRQDFERGEKASPTGEIIPVTFSAGIATYPGHGSSLDEIIFAADGALYESKRTGRNKVSLAKNGGE
ncbi:MAG TPA: hypothetical protein DDZ83_04615 [Nitrospinae bacterium]|nr:hypothetical protein [Nitrospinota bacterium]